jgi:hypothetical protein
MLVFAVMVAVLPRRTVFEHRAANTFRITEDGNWKELSS